MIAISIGKELTRKEGFNSGLIGSRTKNCHGGELRVNNVIYYQGLPLYRNGGVIHGFMLSWKMSQLENIRSTMMPPSIDCC